MGGGGRGVRLQSHHHHQPPQAVLAQCCHCHWDAVLLLPLGRSAATATGMQWKQ